MKTLKILRVFLRLKRQEFKEWNQNDKDITPTDVGRIMLILPFLAIYGIIKLILILPLFLFNTTKWFIGLCRDNWQKATKIVEGK